MNFPVTVAKKAFTAEVAQVVSDPGVHLQMFLQIVVCVEALSAFVLGEEKKSVCSITLLN